MGLDSIQFTTKLMKINKNKFSVLILTERQENSVFKNFRGATLFQMKKVKSIGKTKEEEKNSHQKYFARVIFRFLQIKYELKQFCI